MDVEIRCRMSAAFCTLGESVDRKMQVKMRGEIYRTVARPALWCSAETWVTTRGQECRLEVKQIRMLMWMCGVAKKDNEHVRGSGKVALVAKNIT